jgi:ferric-dicitrate binding protein FerR (iron transport regulator)
MTNKPKSLLYFVIGCLLCLSMPLAGYCQSAYEQLQDAAGQQQGNIPDPGKPVCVGSDCPNAKIESISPKIVNPAVAGMLAKKRRMERILIENIQKYDPWIQKCDETIASSTSIIFKAQKAGNINAEAIARQALDKAQKAKKSYLEQKQKYERQLRQVKKTVEDISGSLMNGFVPADMRGVVSKSSGEVSLLRANSGPKATSLTSFNVGFLAPGDEFQTGNGGKAEVQILSGRGAITMGGNSKLKVEEDNGDAEVVRTLEGKFHFVVDKAEKFQADLETDMAALKDILAQISVDSKYTYERLITEIKAKVQKKLEVKNRGGFTSSIRSTEFVVNEKQDGSCELVVIDGKVEVTEPDGKKSVMVETGHAVLISSEGKLSGVRQLDTTAIIKWWEK